MFLFSSFLPCTCGTTWATYSINGISRKSINTGKNTGKNTMSDKCVSVPNFYCPIGCKLVAQTLQGLGDFLKFIQSNALCLPAEFPQKIQ